MSSFRTHQAPFPATRHRRLRQAPWVRALVSEAVLTPADLIWPVFVTDGTDVEEPVAAMPGVSRHSIDRVAGLAKEAVALGIPAVAIFPRIDPAKKTPDGAEAYNPDNLVCRAIAEFKTAAPELGVICDVALDPFNSDGHDGIVKDDVIVNDDTLAALVKQALVQARAGCDVIAPSDMMDGRVAMIRAALEAEDLQNTMILSYAAKYASAYYGPFRDAVGSGGLLKGDKKTYQMDPANTDEALREVALDIAEGADMVMVKPGLPYLDVLARVKQTFSLPTFAYNVSGEYAMLRHAADAGLLEYDRVVLETLMAFKRAGADGVLTYFAPHAARLLNG